MPEGRHMKASDVFGQSQFFFGQKTTFDRAFPEIEAVAVRVTERGSGLHPSLLGPSSYGKESIGEFIGCRNPTCYNGGFSIGGILRDMARQKRPHEEGKAVCKGYEGSPKGRRRHRSCDHTFDYVVDVQYRSDEDNRGGEQVDGEGLGSAGAPPSPSS